MKKRTKKTAKRRPKIKPSPIPHDILVVPRGCVVSVSEDSERIREVHVYGSLVGPAPLRHPIDTVFVYAGGSVGLQAGVTL